MLLKMTDKLDVRLDGRSIDIEHLDITSYLSAQNRINTCNKHVGTVYRIFPDFSNMGFKEKHTALYNLTVHSMTKIVYFFQTKEGQIREDENGKFKILEVIDWPTSAGFRRDEEFNLFFKKANNLNDYHQEVTDVIFHIEGYHPLRYQTKPYDERVSRLSVFCQQERQFLESYRCLRQLPEFFKPEELLSAIEDKQVQKQAVNILNGFEIEKEKIRCTEGSELQALIPYVKRLLQLFPEIKEKANRALSSEEIRKRVYKIGTKRCIEKVSQCPLELNSDTSRFRDFLQSLREILESEQQKVLQLQFVDGDEWTGLINLYQVLQTTGGLSDFQYIILNLERLLSVNQFVELRTLMQSIQTPYLLMIACEDNKHLDQETKDVIETLCDTIKLKQNIKIIFITRSGGSTVNFLRNMGNRIFGRWLVKRVEQLTWSDLTAISQTKLLNKPVKFQGAIISLNELISAESPAANFVPLGALLEENELTIGDPVQISNGYNESYYIGRTLRCKKTIKQDIFRDASERDSHEYVVRSEQEYKELCQLNPKGIVHWLESDMAGKLVWQQSQGSLETLRKYIDTECSHTYTADDLDKLLEKAQQQRVMLISDTAGMGKSTLLTVLSKQIKQKFPTKWVVRIDLNHHTNALNKLMQEQINKRKAIEFLSEKLMNHKPGLEMELFNLCCVQKQKVTIVVMLDGFDEISPTYKETVFDLLQALMQTAIEQLWVTTRPHLRKGLEDKLQQLTYTLEPFSEKDQIEFLTKFWSLQNWFAETKEKGKDIQKKNLEVYAKLLIQILTESIRDIEREFTGNPLQTSMLAEIFNKEVQAFLQSPESTSELSFKLDLLGLYGRFIKRKYEIYLEEKLGANVNNVSAIGQMDRELNLLREDHQLLSLKVMFTEEQVEFFKNNRECSFSTEDLTRIGIVLVSHDGKPHFIHRTFAEYHVADCLVDLFTEGNIISEQAQTFILKNIFLQNDYRVIRVFMDGLLSSYNPSHEVLKQLGNRIHALGLHDGEQLLDQAVAECNVNIVAILSDSLQAAKHTDTFIRLLLAKDNARRTRWDLAIWGGNLQVIEKLWECANNKLKTEEKNNILLLAQNREKRTVFHTAAKHSRLEVLQKLWDWGNEKLSKEDINNKLLLAKDKWSRTAFHTAADQGRLEILQKIWEWSNEKLTTDEINNNLLLATDYERRTIFHIAVWRERLDIIQEVWEWCNEKPTREEINKSLLLATDNEGRTVFHMAAEKGRLETLQKVWELANETLTTEEINKNLLLASDIWRKTVLHIAVDQGRQEILEKVWEWANEKLTTEAINANLLLATDIEERTVFNMAANKGTLEILEKLWEWANVTLTTEKINNALFIAKGYMGRTVFHMAANGAD
jgi:ankyrin repeat protein